MGQEESGGLHRALLRFFRARLPALGGRVPKTRSNSASPRQPQLAVGEYAGRAVYRPRTKRDLKPELYDAIGKVVTLEFAGIAWPDEPFAGQRLFRERDGEVLCFTWVPERDLEFMPTEDPADASATGDMPVSQPQTFDLSQKTGL